MNTKSVGSNKLNLIFNALVKNNMTHRPIKPYSHVKISQKIDGDTYNYLSDISSTMANFVNSKNAKLEIDILENDPEKILLNLKRRGTAGATQAAIKVEMNDPNEAFARKIYRKLTECVKLL